MLGSEVDYTLMMPTVMKVVWCFLEVDDADCKCYEGGVVLHI